MAINPDVLNPNLEGKLVYVSGPVKTAEVLSDPMFDALWLKRNAEMYQWQEDDSDVVPAGGLLLKQRSQSAIQTKPPTLSLLFVYLPRLDYHIP